MTLLGGQVAIVTGGGRGLGRAVAEMLAGLGASVVIASRNAPELDDVVRDIRKAGGRALAQTADVADDRRALAKVCRNERPALRVEFDCLTVEIHAIEKLEPRGMVPRHQRQLALDFEPDRHRVNSYAIASHAGDEDVRAVLVLNDPPKNRRDFESALFVDPSRSAAPEAPLFHFSPQKSTR